MTSKNIIVQVEYRTFLSHGPGSVRTRTMICVPGPLSRQSVLIGLVNFDLLRTHHEMVGITSDDDVVTFTYPAPCFLNESFLIILARGRVYPA